VYVIALCSRSEYSFTHAFHLNHFVLLFIDIFKKQSSTWVNCFLLSILIYNLSGSDHIRALYLSIINSKVYVCFIMFMLEDDHTLSLRVLILVKCIREFCKCFLYSFIFASYLMFLPCCTLISGISVSLFYLFFNCAEHEILFCLFLNFLEPYGLQMDWGILKRFFFNKYKDSRLRSWHNSQRGLGLGHAMLGANMHLVAPFASVLPPCLHIDLKPYINISMYTRTC
jgi:hypothetical protein